MFDWCVNIQNLHDAIAKIKFNDDSMVQCPQDALAPRIPSMMVELVAAAAVFIIPGVAESREDITKQEGRENDPMCGDESYLLGKSVCDWM